MVYKDGDNYYKKKNKVVIRMKVVRLENEIFILGIVFGIVLGQPYDRKCLWNCPKKTI